MEVRRHAVAIPVLALAAALAVDPSRSRAAAAAPDCVKLVALEDERTARSPVLAFQEELQVHRITAMMVDGIGKQQGLGPAWKAGHPRWEEAYRLLRPDLHANMRVGAERERRYMGERLPPQLDPVFCRKAVAFLATPTGALAARVESGLALSALLADLERAFPVPPHLKPQAEAARRAAVADAARKDAPSVQRTEPGLAAALEEWRGYGRVIAAGMKRMGEPDRETARKENQENGARMMAKNREALAGIVRSFRAGG